MENTNERQKKPNAVKISMHTINGLVITLTASYTVFVTGGTVVNGAALIGLGAHTFEYVYNGKTTIQNENLPYVRLLGFRV